MLHIEHQLFQIQQSKMNRLPQRLQNKQVSHRGSPQTKLRINYCRHFDNKSHLKSDQKFRLPLIQDPGCKLYWNQINKKPDARMHLNLNISDILAQINNNAQKHKLLQKRVVITQRNQDYNQLQYRLDKQKENMSKKIAIKHHEHKQKRKQFVFLLKDQLSQAKRQKRLNISGKGPQIQSQMISLSLTKHQANKTFQENKLENNQSKYQGNFLKPINNVLKPSSKQQGSRRCKVYQSTLSSQGFVLAKQITTIMKPPQRYKTSMVYCKGGQLFLYGGLGCQKNISWSQLDLKTKQWVFPIQTHQILNSTPQQSQYNNFKSMASPLFGHTMNFCKGAAYVFGGTTSDTVYDLTIINIKQKTISSGPKAPFRRRQHASVLMGGKYLIIHGGIQSVNGQPKREMFYYNTQSGKWDVINVSNLYHYSVQSRECLPALSHHGMVCTEVKTKKKIRKLSDLCLGTIYIFGGRTQDGSCSNSLYKVKIKDQHEVSVQKIAFDVNACIPEPRHMSCFEYIGNGFLMLYGGKSADEQDGLNKRNGVYNDILIFNTDSESWIRPQISQQLQYRYGMCSAVSFSNGFPNGKVYIFGGCDLKTYCNANVLVLNVSQIQKPSHSFKSINSKRNIEEEDDQSTNKII